MNYKIQTTTTLSGTKIAYSKYGTGKKKILFVHGNLATSLWWIKTANHLLSGYEGYAIDLPGSGNTPETGKWHTIDYFAELLYEFITSLNLGKIHLVGHSMGGGAAQLFTINHPEMVEKLVLVDTIPMDGCHVMYEYGKEKLRAIYENENLLRKALRSVIPGLKEPELFDQIVAQARQSSEKVYLEHPVTMHEANWSDKIHLITCPTLLIHGEQDNFIPQTHSQKIASAIKNSKFITIKDSGHTPMLETPEEFNSLLFDFL